MFPSNDKYVNFKGKGLNTMCFHTSKIATTKKVETKNSAHRIRLGCHVIESCDPVNESETRVSLFRVKNIQRIEVSVL